MISGYTLFNKFNESRTKIDSTKVFRELINIEDLSNLNYAINLLTRVYSNYSVKNNNLKEIDFAFISRSKSVPDGNISYYVIFEDKTIAYKKDEFIFNFPKYSYRFQFDVLNNEYVYKTFSLHLQTVNNEDRPIDTYGEIDQGLDKLINILESSQNFYEACFNLRENINVPLFVEKYEKYKELVTIMFLVMPKEVKLCLFEEMKKKGKEIIEEDVYHIIGLLRKASHADATFIEGVSDSCPPAGIYHSNRLKKAYENSTHGFDEVKKIFEYNKLNNSMVEKENNKRKVNKV